MKKTSGGQVKLGAIIDKFGIAAVSEATNRSRKCLAQLSCGKRNPSLQTALALWHCAEISYESWLRTENPDDEHNLPEELSALTPSDWEFYE